MSVIISLKAFFLKLISRHQIRPIVVNDSPKFLILMHQNIGDMIVCSPILREIKDALPASNIHVIASNVNKDIAIANPYIDNVIIYNNRWNKLFPILIMLRSCKFDFAIELEAKIITRVILMLKIINPKHVLSVSKREGRYGIDPQGIRPYDYYTDVSINHQRDTCLDILRILNINFKNKKYDIFYSQENKEKALSFLKNLGSNNIIVGLNITGSSHEKRLANTDILKIIDDLHTLSSKIIIILLHKPENKRWMEELISLKNSSYVFPSYPTVSILDVAALVDSVDLLITPDTSLVHIACALEKPLLAIYRNDMVAFDAWHPKSINNHVVFSEESNSLKSLNINEIISKCSELISTNIKKDL